MFINSTFLPKSFQKEKGVILDEIKMLHDDPKAFQWILFLETLFKKNRIRLPVYGDLKIIRNLKRDALLSFYKKYYSSKNIIVSVAGNVKNIKSLVEKQFSSLNSSPVSRWKNPVEIKHTKLESKKKVHKTNQTYFLLGYKTPPAKHKDAPVLDVVRAILDRGQSSRLFDEIRSKRGLAYAVGAAHEDALTYGYFVVSVITNKKNVPRVRRVVLEQLQLPSLSQKELDEAKQYLEGSLILSNEDNLERVERNAVCEFLGRDHKKYMAALKRVSLADVRRVVKKYFHKHFTETIIEQKD
jgi:predicted Zn-dependent peptidase